MFNNMRVFSAAPLKVTLRVMMLVTILATVILLPPRPAAAEDKVVDRIVAVVNEDAILQSDLAQARRDAEREALLLDESDFNISDRDLLQRLIDDRLARQEAKRLNIEVTEAEIESAIADVMSANRMSIDDLKEQLRLQGITYSDYRETIGEQIRRLKLTGRVVRDRVLVDQSRMQAYYSAHREEFREPARVHLRRIVFPLTAGTPEVVRGQAEITYKALQKTPYAALATNIVDAGGDLVDLGFFEAGDLREDFASIAEDLQPGEWSKPLPTPGGIHLLQVADRLPSRILPFDQVKEQIEERLSREEADRQFVRWMQELRDASHIRILL